MKFSTYEAVGVAGSIAVMAVALWLLNLESANERIVNLGSETNTAAVVVGGDDNQEAALADALLEAGLENGAVNRLVVDDVVLGSGPAVTEGDSVTVHYIGTLTNGTEFDNSYTRGTPFTFTVGSGRVIPGWEQGLVGMQAGGQRVLVIPPELGYGAEGGGPIPANATLVFAIELIAIE